MSAKWLRHCCVSSSQYSSKKHSTMPWNLTASVKEKKSSSRFVKADGLFICSINMNSVFLIKWCVINPTCTAHQRQTRSGLYAHTSPGSGYTKCSAALARAELPPSHPSTSTRWGGSWGFSLAPGKIMGTLFSFVALVTSLPASNKIRTWHIDEVMQEVTEVLPVGKCLSLI